MSASDLVHRVRLTIISSFEWVGKLESFINNFFFLRNFSGGEGGNEQSLTYVRSRSKKKVACEEIKYKRKKNMLSSRAD